MLLVATLQILEIILPVISQVLLNLRLTSWLRVIATAFASSQPQHPK